MRETITTCGELCGAALISVGLWAYSPTLGLMSAGAGLAFFSWLAAPR